MSTYTVRPARGPLRGEERVPGDKSLSHRAVLFASMAEGTSHLSGVLSSADVWSTIRACGQLGAEVHVAEQDDGSLSITVTGWGPSGPREPFEAIDCGNSGTTARLLLGVLAGWPVRVTLTGDASLSRRPMKRVTEPLSAMGASFETAPGGTLPVTVVGSATLKPVRYDSPVASAQVKTALLLAGTRASGRTRVTEPSLSRDHTERLLPAFGIPVGVDDEPAASVEGPAVPRARDVFVPGDPSSAAFLCVGALLVPVSSISLPEVSLNPTRTGFLAVLARMGADIEVQDRHEAGAEPAGTVIARFTDGLTATLVSAVEVPSLVDEVPVLALLAAKARGTTRFEGIGELRVKESDRLQAMCEGLSALGVSVRSGDTWLEVDGPAAFDGATLDSLGDHRLAMCWSLAGLVSTTPVTVLRHEAIEVSYPSFVQALSRLGA